MSVVDMYLNVRVFCISVYSTWVVYSTRVVYSTWVILMFYGIATNNHCSFDQSFHGSFVTGIIVTSHHACEHRDGIIAFTNVRSRIHGDRNGVWATLAEAIGCR